MRREKGGSKKEETPTYLSLESGLLGKLTMEYYKAVSAIIYKDRPPRTRPQLVE